MKSVLIGLAHIVLAAAIVGAAGDAAQDAERQLKAAMNTELVDGNLKAAIEQYKQVAQSGNRGIAAQALLRMAECYQKLGDAEAQKVYARILREFPDQKEQVALARGRLGSSAISAMVKGDRAVWTGPKVDLFGQVSPDGRFITYVDWGGDQNLMVHDLVTKTDRALTAAPSLRFSQFAEYSAISKDGKHVAYTWFNETGRYDLRVVPLHGPAPADPRKLFGSNDDIRSIAPVDWSSDGRWIAVNIQRADGTGQIGLVGVSDGALRVLKSVDWRGASKIAFSPDDRYIAYDLAIGDAGTERHMYLMAIDGSRETPLVADKSRNVVMGWTPGSDDVLFASDRSGETALWTQRVLNGNPRGGPALLKRDIVSSVSLGLTRSGTMYVYRPASANFVQVAALDLETARIHPAGANTLQRFVGTGGEPSWSADGKFLVYKSCGPPPRARCAINVAPMDGGEVRQVWPMLSYLGGLRLSRDGRSFVAVGRDTKGRQGIFRIDAENSAVSPILTPRPGAIEQLSTDQKTVYFRRPDSRGAALLARDLSTGIERELFRQTDTTAMSMKVSPDGHYIAAMSGPVLYVLPTAGGAPTEVLRAKPGESFDGYRAEWTPDSRSLVLPKRVAGQNIELWVVPMFDRGALRRVDADASGWVLGGGGFAIHPSGRQIAFVGAAGKQGAEVWALENFLPALKASR